MYYNDYYGFITSQNVILNNSKFMSNDTEKVVDI